MTHTKNDQGTLQVLDQGTHRDHEPLGFGPTHFLELHIGHSGFILPFLPCGIQGWLNGLTTPFQQVVVDPLPDFVPPLSDAVHHGVGQLKPLETLGIFTALSRLGILASCHLRDLMGHLGILGIYHSRKIWIGQRKLLAPENYSLYRMVHA